MGRSSEAAIQQNEQEAMQNQDDAECVCWWETQGKEEQSIENLNASTGDQGNSLHTALVLKGD